MSMKLSMKDINQMNEFNNTMSKLDDNIVSFTELSKIMATSLNYYIGSLRSCLKSDHSVNIMSYMDYLADATVQVPMEISNLHASYKDEGLLSRSDFKKGIHYIIPIMIHYRNAILSGDNYHIPDVLGKCLPDFIKDYYSSSKEYLSKRKQTKVRAAYKCSKFIFKFI